MPVSILQNLINESGILVSAKDDNGCYLFANRKFIDDLALQDIFQKGVTDRDLFSAEVAERLQQHDARVIGANAPCVDEEIFPLAGEERVYRFHRFRLRGAEGPQGIGAVGIELTQRSRMEGSLLASPALFKGILDIAADAIISIDESQKIVLFNQGAERIFGYSADEVIGQPLEVLLPPVAHPAHKHHVRHFGRSGGGARQMGERGSISGRRKDGTIFPAEASISRIELSGRTTYTAILRDVTEARSAEASIISLNADLKHRAHQLESANRELEAFSYSVSHDLRAPLRSIDGFSQVLIEDYADTLPEDAQDSLQRIRFASQRMAQLIDDMLSLSRVTRSTLSRTEVNLSAMARSIAGELAASQPARRVTFKIADGITANADPHLIQIALNNLLGNAWKFTSKRDEGEIEFGTYAGDNGKTVYFVRDNGAGFDMSYAGKLFGVFQRLHAMNEYSGTGVGLATVQRIIHKHGGEVAAEGAVDKGATFTFTLG